MPVESAADRAVFLNAAEFGASAVYTPAGGSAQPAIEGIFEAPYAAADAGLEVNVSSSAPTFRCRSADLPAGAAAGDAVAISGAPDPYDDGNYDVVDLQPDGTGMTILELNRSQGA